MRKTLEELLARARGTPSSIINGRQKPPMKRQSPDIAGGYGFVGCPEARIVLKPFVCCTFMQPQARRHRATRRRNRLYTHVARVYDSGHENTLSPAVGTVVQPAASPAGDEGERDRLRSRLCVVGRSSLAGK